ncbi:MAG: 50S ribosomal protein L35 [Alphaproteobacteria bacterium]
MPKLKTNSSAKKRFRFTASGKVVRPFGFKQHNMRKRNSRMVRQARGTTIMSESDTKRMKQLMPYG